MGALERAAERAIDPGVALRSLGIGESTDWNPGFRIPAIHLEPENWEGLVSALFGECVGDLATNEQLNLNMVDLSNLRIVVVRFFTP